MKTITKDKANYAMSRANKPFLTVAPGESFRVEMEDCYSGNLRTTSDKFTKEMWSTVNPATGPIFIEGAEPGDLLRVDIEKIETRDHAVMCLEHGSSPLGDQIEGVETSILPIRGGRIQINAKLSLPVQPMIGVIGTAPEGEPILNGTPGEHGGNMDTREIAAGAKIYLPVNVLGALLSMGDIHALMGDGEVCICGAEVSGAVTARAWPVRAPIPTPCVENDEYVMLLGSALTLDECQEIVLEKAHQFLVEHVGLSANEAARLMSLVGHLRVSQVVDPLKTMKFLLPKAILRQLGVQFPLAGEKKD